MTEYKLYPNLPSAPLDVPLQVGYHLSIAQAKRRVFIDKEAMFKKKYKKYNRILNRLMWLNACSSGISVATGISSVATFATFIGKYQKELKKVTKLIDIVTPALVVFERVISGALKDGIIDEEYTSDVTS